MRNKFVLALCCFLLVGCGNLSPRLNEKINNQQGQIEEIENNQNSIKNELLNLRNEQNISDSELKEIQQGIFNLQSNNSNSGIQIFSGPGGILIAAIAICAFFILTMTSYYYKSVADKNEKIVCMLAEKIISFDNQYLNEEILKAASYTEVEDDVFTILSRKKS